MTERIPSGLSSVLAYARAGALGIAWSTFVEGGFQGHSDDPAILTVKGRLLKDRARQSAGAERLRLFSEAAHAYASAAAAEASTYPLINAATLSLLGGKPAQSAAYARDVLMKIDARPDEPETPYWRAATRAEAALLLNRNEEARAALTEAIGLAPRAWEDHASTLRQFRLILEAQRKDTSWLDAHRPPCSLHFGGHMSFDAKVVRREHLDEKIAAALDEEQVGFGYGALAAGADVIIAEALLARGAELHAVLPGGMEAFAAVSVDPFGKAWRRRFDAVLERAETVRSVRPLGTAPDRMMIGLADEIAMGVAVMNARRLESRALQLLVLADEPAAAAENPPHAHARWADAGWRQRVIVAPREALAGKPSRLSTAPHSRLALLSIALAAGGGLSARLAQIADWLAGAGAPRIPPHFTGRNIILAYAEAADATHAAVTLAAVLAGEEAPGIGGHYGITHLVEDPFTGAQRMVGDPVDLAIGAAASAPPGSVCVTADFAAALAASGEPDVYSELIGELTAPDASEPVELFALKARL